MSDSPGQVSSVLNLPNGKCCFFGKFKLRRDCNQFCESKRVLGSVEITCGLAHASYSLPEWQAVKRTFFAPCFLYLSGSYWFLNFLIKSCSSLNISASLQIISCSFSGTFVTNVVYLQVPKEYQSPLCSPPIKYHQADMGHPSEGFKVQDLSVIYCIYSSFLFLSLFCSMHPFPKW